MARYRGIIMEIKGQKAILLTPDALFVEVVLPPGREYRVGEEVEGEAVAEPSFRKKMRLSALVAAAAVILLFLAGLFAGGQLLFQQQEAVAAYVTVDINPSLELAVDGEGRVKTVTALNEEGTAVSRYLQRGEPVDAVVAEAVRIAGERGYFPQEGEKVVLVAVTPVAGREADVSRWQRQIEDRVKENRGVLVATVVTSPSLRQEARKLGLSPGEYALVLTAFKAGYFIEPAAVKEKAVAVAVKEVGANPAQLIANLRQQETLEGLSASYRNHLAAKEKEKKEEKKRQEQKDDKDGKEGRGSNHGEAGRGNGSNANAGGSQALPANQQRQENLSGSQQQSLARQVQEKERLRERDQVGERKEKGGGKDREE